MSPPVWQDKHPGWPEWKTSGVSLGLSSPARLAPARLMFSWETHPVSWVPRTARRPWETFCAVALGIRKGGSRAHEMGMPMRWGWASLLESGVGSGPSIEHPHHPLTFSPFRPGGPAGPRGPGSPGRPCKRAQLSPRGHRSALGTHGCHSPTPLCHPHWPGGQTHRGARLPSRCCPIHKSRGALQRQGSASAWQPQRAQSFPAPWGGCGALGHPRGLCPGGQTSQRNAEPLTLSPRSPFSPCKGKKKCR